MANEASTLKEDEGHTEGGPHRVDDVPHANDEVKREEDEVGREGEKEEEREEGELMEMETDTREGNDEEEVHLTSRPLENMNAPPSLSPPVLSPLSPPTSLVPSPHTPPTSIPSFSASSSSSSFPPSSLSSSFSSSQSDVKEEKLSADSRSFLDFSSAQRNGESSQLRVRKGWEDAYGLVRMIQQSFPMSIEAQTQGRAAVLLEQCASLQSILQSLVKEEDSSYSFRGSALTPPPMTYVSSSSSSFGGTAQGELRTSSGNDLASLFREVSMAQAAGQGKAQSLSGRYPAMLKSLTSTDHMMQATSTSPFAVPTDPSRKRARSDVGAPQDLPDYHPPPPGAALPTLPSVHQLLQLGRQPLQHGGDAMEVTRVAPRMPFGNGSYTHGQVDSRLATIADVNQIGSKSDPLLNPQGGAQNAQFANPQLYPSLRQPQRGGQQNVFQPPEVLSPTPQQQIVPFSPSPQQQVAQYQQYQQQQYLQQQQIHHHLQQQQIQQQQIHQQMQQQQLHQQQLHQQQMQQQYLKQQHDQQQQQQQQQRQQKPAASSHPLPHHTASLPHRQPPPALPPAPPKLDGQPVYFVKPASLSEPSKLLRENQSRLLSTPPSRTLPNSPLSRPFSSSDTANPIRTTTTPPNIASLSSRDMNSGGNGGGVTSLDSTSGSVKFHGKLPLFTAYDGRKHRKKKPNSDLRCLECFAKETPEWRRGPMGPKTLCNACGLKYAKVLKMQKEKEGKGGVTGMGPTAQLTGVTTSSMGGGSQKAAVVNLTSDDSLSLDSLEQSAARFLAESQGSVTNVPSNDSSPMEAT